MSKAREIAELGDLVNVEGSTVNIGDAASDDVALSVDAQGQDVKVRIGGIGAENQGDVTSIRLQSQDTSGTNVYADIRLEPEAKCIAIGDPGTSGATLNEGPLRIDGSGNVSVYNASFVRRMNIAGTDPDNSDYISIGMLGVNNSINCGIDFCRGDGVTKAGIRSLAGGAYAKKGLSFLTNNASDYTTEATEKMRITSDGIVLVGTTDLNLYNTTTSTGVLLSGGIGNVAIARSGNRPLDLNRLSTDGDILRFAKNGTNVGSIVIGSGIRTMLNGYPISHSGGTGMGLGYGTVSDNPVFFPADGSYVPMDNICDLGYVSGRFDDIYATNGTIQTSDRNEKQDIDVLSEAETRVAQACKGLLRKFRWKDAVAEKGDDARIHFGIIAQDLQDAFAAEGLDAGRYAMFISSTWWEADEVIPAVEAVEAVDAVYEDVVIPAVLDEEGNEIEPEFTEQRLVSEAVEAVEAQPERTVTHHYETAEEAPEGAVERTRLGVRYPELLAFIVGAL